MDQFGLKAMKAWNERQRPVYRLITVTPITSAIGAEIGGVDLSKEISPELFAEIEAALVDHQVVVFRDQQLSGENHKAFGRMFGTLHAHPTYAAYDRAEAAGDEALMAKLKAFIGDDPEIVPIKADEMTTVIAGEDWHSDVTCDEEPPMGSMLYMLEPPGDGGGDTLFLNSHLAYETLSPSMQQYLEGLTAIHTGRKAYEGSLKLPMPPGGWPEAEHPIVVRHPISGRKLLYVNLGFTDSIPQLAPHESDALLNMLYRHCACTPEIQCRVHWEPNTLVFWDNRATQHRALWDYYPARRMGKRVTIKGERPYA
jgi:taurine dioxygenase